MCSKGNDKWQHQEHHHVPPLLLVRSTRRNKDRGIDVSNRNHNTFYLSLPGPLSLCTILHSRLGLLCMSGSPPLSVYSCFFFIPGLFCEGPWTPSVGSQAQGLGRVSQGLPQTTVEMLNVPAQAPLPGTGQTEEVLHPMLSKPHWKRRLSWACVPKTWGIAVKLPVHGAYAEACTGTAAWQM